MLMPLFVLAVLSTVIAVAAVAVAPANLITLYIYLEHAELSNAIEWEWSWWWPNLWMWTTLLCLLVILLCAIGKRGELAGGGGRVAELVGGRRVDPKDDEPVAEGGLSPRELVHVVEEMAVASGLPVPRVYVLPRENSINAFAGGVRPDDACIAVTRGALKYLSRDELQAVVAHEFSHILHGDTKLNHRMIILVFGVGGIGMVGTGMVRTMAGTFSHPVMLFPLGCGILLAAIGSIGAGAARLLQVMTNRHREYLADASAVQFTRNPAGLAGALKKIGGYRRKGRLLNLHASEIAHMCIAPSSFQAIETHPPLLDRILRFDKAFDGTFERVGGDDSELLNRLTATENRIRRQWQKERDEASTLRMAEALLAGSVIASAGTITRSNVLAARRLLGNLPAGLREAVHEPAGAMAVVLALVADCDEEVRDRELAAVAVASPAVAERARTMCELSDGLDARHRLPLLDMALPTLQDLDLAERLGFLDLLRRAIDADNERKLLELCYWKIMEHALAPRPTVPRSQQVYSVQGYDDALGPIFSVLANCNVNPDRAYEIACEKLRIRRICERIPMPTTCNLADGLDRLATAPPPIQKRILDAAATCVATDYVIEPREHELLRALAATMNVPLPPTVETAAMAHPDA